MDLRETSPPHPLTLNEHEEIEDNVYMDNLTEAGFIGNSDNILCVTDEETNPEAMDEESGDITYDLEYRQNEAMKNLSSIFKFLDIDPIHDKYDQFEFQ